MSRMKEDPDLPITAEPSSGDGGPTASTVRLPVKFDTPLRSWLVFRIPTALVWTWFCLLLWSGINGVFQPPLKRHLLLVPAAGSFILLLALRQWFTALGYLFYIPLFPATAAISGTIGLADFVLIHRAAFAKMFRGAFSGLAMSVILLTDLTLWYSTWHVASPSIRARLALAAHLLTYFLFLQSFRWAANPFRPISTALAFLSKAIVRILRFAIIDPATRNPRSHKDNALRALTWFRRVDAIYQAKAPLKSWLPFVTHGSLAPAFIGFFVIAYFLLALSFSLALEEIESAWGPIFEGLGPGTNHFTYFYFSLLSQATAVPEGIRPVSTFGQVWIIWLVMTGVLLLTSLITLFTTSMGIYAEQAMQDSAAHVDEFKQSLEPLRSAIDALEVPVETNDPKSGS